MKVISKRFDTIYDINNVAKQSLVIYYDVISEYKFKFKFEYVPSYRFFRLHIWYLWRDIWCTICQYSCNTEMLNDVVSSLEDSTWWHNNEPENIDDAKKCLKMLMTELPDIEHICVIVYGV